MTILTKERQTIFDLAISYYGTLDGVWKILEDNPNIQFDDSFTDIGIPEIEYYPPEGCIDFSMPVKVNQSIEIDSEWEGRNNDVLKLLNNYISQTA